MQKFWAAYVLRRWRYFIFRNKVWKVPLGYLMVLLLSGGGWDPGEIRVMKMTYSALAKTRIIKNSDFRTRLKNTTKPNNPPENGFFKIPTREFRDFQLIQYFRVYRGYKIRVPHHHVMVDFDESKIFEKKIILTNFF